jgi:hypothetical protein
MPACLVRPRRASRGLCLVCARFVPHRVIRRRPIRAISAGAPISGVRPPVSFAAPGPGPAGFVAATRRSGATFARSGPPAGGTRTASCVPDRVIRRRPIRVISAGAASRRPPASTRRARVLVDGGQREDAGGWVIFRRAHLAVLSEADYVAAQDARAPPARLDWGARTDAVEFCRAHVRQWAVIWPSARSLVAAVRPGPVPSTYCPCPAFGVVSRSRIRGWS